MSTRANKIREFLLKNIPKHSNDIVLVAVEHFKVSRMTIHRHLENLIENNQHF